LKAADLQSELMKAVFNKKIPMVLDELEKIKGTGD